MLGRKSASKRAGGDGSPARLIVGLGNPGPDYEWTRHNLGFLAIDALAGRAGIRVTRPEAKSQVGRGEIAGQAVVLAKPQTAMNLSGVAVRMLLEKYESDPARMIVLFDEVDLPWGTLRIRPKGSGGTHNGMKSVIREIGTNEFTRIRLGIGPEKIWGDLKDYVLGKMDRAERDMVSQMTTEAAEAIEIILADGVEKAMRQFNRRKTPGETQEGAEEDSPL
jgi:peptidyl-tRNA hydrolase, PTH1 family